MRVARLISLVLLLQSRETMTAAELARELEVSERTIYRDVLALSLEAALEARDWLAGDVYTLADVSLTSYINRAAELQLHPMWERTRPRVTDWFARVQDRDNFRTAFGNYPYEAYAAQMKEQGTLRWPQVEAALAYE